MGARPYGYTLVLALPRDLTDQEAWLERFAAGLGHDQAEYGIHLLGGDSVSTTGPITVSITAFGMVAVDRQLRRSGASAGDDMWVRRRKIGSAAWGDRGCEAG